MRTCPGRVLVAALLLAGCSIQSIDRSTSRAEAISLLGDPLYPPPLPEDLLVEREAKLAAARAAFDRDPNDVDAIGEKERAAGVLESIHAAMEIIENESYHKLLLMYRGDLSVEQLLAEADAAIDDATVGYGLGNWHFYNERRDKAFRLWRGVLDSPQWAAFGYIAAEAELARRKGLGARSQLP